MPSVTDREYVRARAPFYPRFDHDRFARYVREFELPQGRKLTAMSHGQQKKFLLSFGLACDSAVLLLDEPTNGLDIPSKGQFRRTIAEAATPERLFVISTHQVRDLGALIDPIVVLHQRPRPAESLAGRDRLADSDGAQLDAARPALAAPPLQRADRRRILVGVGDAGAATGRSISRCCSTRSSRSPNAVLSVFASAGACRMSEQLSWSAPQGVASQRVDLRATAVGSRRLR